MLTACWENVLKIGFKLEFGVSSHAYLKESSKIINIFYELVKMHNFGFNSLFIKAFSKFLYPPTIPRVSL